MVRCVVIGLGLLVLLLGGAVWYLLVSMDRDRRRIDQDKGSQ